MFLLFILHHVLNGNWYNPSLKAGILPPKSSNSLWICWYSLAMIWLMVSGIMLSNHVFSFLNIHGGMSFARPHAYGGIPLGLCPDGAASGTALEHIPGYGQKSVETSAAFPCTQDPASHFGSWNRNLWPGCVYSARFTYLYVLADGVCIPGFWRIDSAFLSGLSGNDGYFHFPRLLYFQATAEDTSEKKKCTKTS